MPVNSLDTPVRIQIRQNISLCMIWILKDGTLIDFLKVLRYQLYLLRFPTFCVLLLFLKNATLSLLFSPQYHLLDKNTNVFIARLHFINKLLYFCMDPTAKTPQNLFNLQSLCFAKCLSCLTWILCKNQNIPIGFRHATSGIFLILCV